MSCGFSVYFGLDNTVSENKKLLELASELGYKRIFTSFHIPEANYEVFKDEVLEFFKIAKKYDMDIISDISPNTFKFLNLENMDLNGLKNLGVQTIRIDFGYSSSEIAKMSKNEYGIKLQFNASTITGEFFEELNKYNPSYENIDALHNFYPRCGTGISEGCMIKKNTLLKEYGIKASAFVMSNNRKRSPLCDGLPTLESHRNINIKDAANHLFALGNECVFIGDSLASRDEMIEISKLKAEVTELDIILKTGEDFTKKLMIHEYASRTDEARDCIRAAESRLLLDGNIIEKENTVDISIGDITIDNKAYGRYMGELQISKVNKAFDERTNVVASVKEKDIYLLKYIVAGRKFHLNFNESEE